MDQTHRKFNWKHCHVAQNLHGCVGWEMDEGLFTGFSQVEHLSGHMSEHLSRNPSQLLFPFLATA